MCVAQHRWKGCKGLCSPALPLTLLLLLPLSFFSSTPLFAHGAIQIPNDFSQPPVLTEETELLRSYTAFSKEDIDLPCEATGNPPPIFRWVKDGELFGPLLNESGTIMAGEEEPLESYQGHYRCYASNTLGTAMTQTVKIIVEPQPVLLKQQKVHKKAYEGESIILTCNPPESSTPPYIHWMDKKMVHIQQNDDRVMVGLDGNLYFSNVLKSDSRDDYTCYAQYAAARTILPDTAVTLTVMTSNDVAHGKRPQLFLPRGSHTSLLALQGHSVTLECIPKGQPTPKVDWKKKDGKLEETGGRKENHNRWLYFDSITQKDDGEYECEATNGHGKVKHSFTLTVEAAPYWVKHPQNLLYAPGETVRLECLAEGVPTPIITWSINGKPLAEVDDDQRRSVNMGVLKMDNVQFADTAVYQCEATNKHGSILINTYLYVIELPPQILSSNGVAYKVAEGKNIEMHCMSFGSPRPHVRWEGEDPDPLLSDPRISLLTNGTLQISSVVHDDAGMYMCYIEHSNISISAHLEVFNRTVITTDPQDVRELRGSSVFLDCRFDKDPRLSKYKIVWLKDGWMLEESSLSDKYTVFNNGTLKVTDLESDDTGYYSCEVSTSLDKVMASGSITVVAPPDPPENLALSNVKDWSLTLSWIPGKSHNSPITDFIVEAREEQHTEQGKWMWEEIEKVSGEFNNMELNLHPFCTYRFRVIAVNQVGRSAPSESTVFYSTPPAVPRHNPTGVRSDSTDPDTLVVMWDEMHMRQHNGQDFQYKVLWREPGGQWNHGYAKSPPFHVNNTGTYTPFEIKVQAVNSLGEGPRPKAEIGHSGEDKPEEAPTGVKVTVTNSTIRLTWNEAQRVQGRLLGYKIYIERLGSQGPRGRRSLGKRHHETGREGKSERIKEKQSREVVVHGMKTSEEVSGLQLFSKYEVSMSVFNSKGESPQSPPVHFNTPEGAPGPPASLTFQSPSDKSLTLHWTPPIETNGVLLGYMVQYQQVVKDQKSEVQIELIGNPSQTHLALDNLDPSSYYNFNVTARTAAGYGPPFSARGATMFDGVSPTNITVTPSDTSLNLSWVPGERERNHEFQIEYCRKTYGAPWELSEVLNSSQGFYTLTGLKPGSEYHLRIMQGNDSTWQVLAFTIGAVPSVSGGFAAQGWLIGLISAILLLILILLILCLIKRSKGGKYAVKDKEDKEVDSEARPMKDETFGEYSDADEKHSDSQPSLCGESKLGSDDSLAEYGDSVDIQFNEDGSFIGQYSGRAPAPQGNESSGPASPVNAVPPPPIAPSMSTILNRPS